ncbi:MAG: hypothetical protein FWG64_01305 [Firmicutes bacterium]|nr:hypothetical protein [Bacillota bacterium]
MLKISKETKKAEILSAFEKAQTALTGTDNEWDNLATMTEEEEMEYIVKMIKESRRERWERDWQFNAEKNCWVYIGDSETAYKQQHMIIKPTDNGKFCTAFDKSAYQAQNSPF